MNILDFERTDNCMDDYFVYDTVWGQKTRFNIAVENENDYDKPDLEGFNVGKLIRPLKKKIDFLEHNRALIEETIMREDFDEITEDIVKSLYLDDAFFLYYLDTGNCELGVYLISDEDILEDCTLILNIGIDNTVVFEDFLEG